MSDPRQAFNLQGVSPAEAREQAQNAAREASLASKPPEAITLLIEGKEVPVISANISRSIDTMADAWTCDIQWIPGKDKDLDNRVGPYSYAKAQIFIGSRLVNTGRLYSVKNHFDEQGLTKHLEFWSYTADLIDSHMPPLAGWEWQNSSLYDIASGLCQALGASPPLSVGISQIVTGPLWTQISEPFDFVQGQITETYADLFTKLAFQRGALVTNDRYGMLLITHGATSGPVVASLGEQDLQAYMQSIGAQTAKSQGWEAAFDGRKRFATYAIYGQTGYPIENKDANGNYLTIESEASDEKVPISRRTNIIVSDVPSIGGSGVTAAWHRSRQLVESLSIPFPVIGFYTPKGDLWNPNDFVIVQAPSLDINIATKFLVRQIDYEHSAAGQTATLHLVPPEVYTGETVREPWSGRIA